MMSERSSWNRLSSASSFDSSQMPAVSGWDGAAERAQAKTLLTRGSDFDP